MFKSFLVTIAVLLSYQVLSINAGCDCQATNQTCVQTCGIELVQCIYRCEKTPTDACTNSCLDSYWPIIENGEGVNIHLPFVKRDSDPTSVMPSSHHRDEDGEGRGYGNEKNRGEGEFRGDGHNNHNGGGEGSFEFPPEKGRDENNHFDGGAYDNYKEGRREEFYPKDDFGPREGYRNRSMAVTSDIFTKTTVSIIGLAIASACMIAF